MSSVKMNYVRALKVAVKNLFRLHPRYFPLLGRTRQKEQPGTVIEREHVFIIASCINIADRTTSFIHNPSHSAAQRFEEVVVGLEAVRKHYPQAYIVLIESSRLDDTMLERLARLADAFYDYSNDIQIDRARRHYNKGVPQFVAYLKFLEENQLKFKADFFHFLSARYVLTGTQALGISETGSYFLLFPKANNVSTRYFFTKNVPIAGFTFAFRATLFFAILGSSVEDVIHQFMPKIHFLQKLNVAGNINGKQFIEE